MRADAGSLDLAAMERWLEARPGTELIFSRRTVGSLLTSVVVVSRGYQLRPPHGTWAAIDDEPLPVVAVRAMTALELAEEELRPKESAQLPSQVEALRQKLSLIEQSLVDRMGRTRTARHYLSTLLAIARDGGK